MALDTRTPGVYVEEISIFPPSVTSVATAIPAFVGYTTAAAGTIARISSMNDYVATFGGPNPYWETAGTATTPTVLASTDNYMMYYAMQMYFINGGGPCYVVSAGEYGATADPADFGTTYNTGALGKILLEDEVTLIVMPDLRLLTEDQAYTVYIAALNQCSRLQDRFTIIDIWGEIDDFHTKIGTNNLKYGAAYYPDLETSLSIPLEAVLIDGNGGLDGTSVASNIAAPTADWLGIEKNVRAGIGELKITVPPSAAIAGVYAAVDRSRGVWKAPANVSLSAVLRPTVTITHDDQLDMNVPTNGKAVNAIRAFTGKGILVWGARTLAGNDNEWRYVSVRRLFIMMEESIRKATEWVVFEPNDANTWLKVKTMIENYLNGLWKDGALAGATPKDAFFVKVGLNQTMTAEDILNGKLIVEIGAAAVRPAEFVILRFSHKLQES